ncbi:MAG: hypothetical protein RIQ81_1940 [Pseudomonadota bacterium]|jgi:putative ABC transport system permease protein
MKTLISLAWKSLLNRRTTTILTIFAIGLSMSLLLVVERLRRGAEEGFTGVISQTDLIAGARSGPVQLMLYSVFQIGTAANSVSPATWEHFKKHPAVSWTIPVALGDSHRGFPVVATNDDMFLHYRYRKDRGFEFVSGGKPASPQDVVIGATVARELGYRIGSEVILAHGMARESFVTHSDKPFRVSGVLSPSGTPYDRSLFIKLEAMASLHHQDDHGHDDHEHADHGSEESTLPGLTAFFIGTKARTDALGLQREIQTWTGEPLTAALPGLTLAQLWAGLSYADGVLRLVAVLVIIVGLLSMVVALYNSLNERRREMAILRALGAHPSTIITMLLAESAMVTGAAVLVSLALTYATVLTASGVIGDRFGIHLPVTAPSLAESLMVGIMFLTGLLMAAVPARRAYRNALVDGLTIRI